jgi:hypothetical protein
MPVNTKTVETRRDVHYDSFQDLVEDAESLAADECKTVGNWTFAQILFHVTAGLHAAVDGFGFVAPWPMRVMAKLLMKKKFLKTPVPAGYEIPTKLKAKFAPQDLPLDEALADLRAAVERLETTDARAPHPFFGKVTRDESDKLQLRHAELHMSFVVPAS